MVPIIPLMLVLQFNAGYLDGYELDDRLVKWNMTYEQAKTHCESFSAGLLPDDKTDRTTLQEQMLLREIPSIWMGINLINLVNWTWVDGDKDTPLGTEQGTGGRVCAGISSASKTIHPKSCDYGSDLEGVICQHTGTIDDCQRNPSRYCFEADSVVFSFKCGVDNWYDARFQCQTINASMAKLNSTGKIEEFVKTKNQISSLSLCSFFWIGLRKEEWMIQYGTGDPLSLTIPRWLPQQPLYGPHCVTFEKQSMSVGWKTTSCADRHSTICMISKQVTSTTPNAVAAETRSQFLQTIMQTTSDIPKDPRGFGIRVAAIACAAAVGLFFLVIIIYCCSKKIKRKPSQLPSKKALITRKPTEDNTLKYKQRMSGSMTLVSTDVEYEGK